MDGIQLQRSEYEQLLLPSSLPSSYSHIVYIVYFIDGHGLIAPSEGHDVIMLRAQGLALQVVWLTCTLK